MKQLRFIVPVVMFVLSFMFVGIANAQPRPTPTNVPNGPTQTNASQEDDSQVNKGSIRGGVYTDTNNDGRCTGDEERVPGVPVSFYNGGVKTVTLTTGDDGTYGLVAAKFGEWDVKVEPPSGWRVLGSDTIHVNILGGGSSSETVLNVNFCVTQSSTSAGTFLPQAGADSVPSSNGGLLFGILFVSVALVGSGIAVEWRRRSQMS